MRRKELALENQNALNQELLNEQNRILETKKFMQA
jgi:hypothetical protein